MVFRAEGRARTRNQIQLTRLIMATGDPIEAAASAPRSWTGQAPCAPAAPSTTCANLRHLSQPHAHLTDVADLHDRIRTVVAAA